MDLQSAKQADDGVRYTLGDFGQGTQLGGRRFCQPIEPPVHALEHASIAQTLQVCARDAGLFQVPRSHWSFAGESEE